MYSKTSKAAKRYASSTHLDPSHFALMAAQAALRVASAHRHIWGPEASNKQGERIGAHTLQASLGTQGRLDWTGWTYGRENARADVGRIRRDTRVWSEVSSHYCTRWAANLEHVLTALPPVEIYRQG